MQTNVEDIVTSDCAKTKIFGQDSLAGHQNQHTFWIFSHSLTLARELHFDIRNSLSALTAVRQACSKFCGSIFNNKINFQECNYQTGCLINYRKSVTSP